MKTYQAKRLREPGRENGRLTLLLADAEVDNAMPAYQGAAAPDLCPPSQFKIAVSNGVVNIVAPG